MSKSHPFSIYLLKEGYNSTNAFTENNRLRSSNGVNLPPGMELFIHANEPHEPWWKDYFGITEILSQQTAGALAILNIHDRNFAISFGNAYHNILNISYEYNFGLMVTLNCVDPAKLQSTDFLDLGTTKRQRTQLQVPANLMLFDFNHDEKILNRLTGIVKSEYAKYFRHATGSSSLHLQSKISTSELKTLCEDLYNLYVSKVYLEYFPHFHDIC